MFRFKFQSLAVVLVVLSCCVVAQRGKTTKSSTPAQESSVLDRPTLRGKSKLQIQSVEVAQAMYTPPITSSQAVKAVASKFGQKASQLAADKNSIEFTPRHFLIPGCTFETESLLEFRAAPKAFCWPMTNRGDIIINVPVNTTAEFAVVTVNGSFPSKNNTYGLRVGSDGRQDTNRTGSYEFIVTKDNNERSGLGWQIADEVGEHFNSNLVVQLKGTKSLNIRIISSFMESYTFISSVQVHYVSAI